MDGSMNTEQAMEQLQRAGIIPPSRPDPIAATVRAIWPRPRFQRRNITPVILRAAGLLRNAPPVRVQPHLTCIPRVLSSFAA